MCCDGEVSHKSIFSRMSVFGGCLLEAAHIARPIAPHHSPSASTWCVMVEGSDHAGSPAWHASVWHPWIAALAGALAGHCELEVRR